MGGVDDLSRVLVPYALARKGVKWYRKLAEVFTDFAIYNAYIIWKNLKKSKKTHLQFREALVDAIIMHHVNDEGSGRPGPYCKPSETKNLLRLKEKHFISRIPAAPSNTRKRKKCVRSTAMKKRHSNVRYVMLHYVSSRVSKSPIQGNTIIWRHHLCLPLRKKRS